MTASPRLTARSSSAALVLAAGSGSRFSGRPGEKLLAPIDGEPMLARVLAVLRDHGPVATVVVLGHGADAIEAALHWRDEVRVQNPAPEHGISTSLRVGVEALAALQVEMDGTFVVLADQPNLRVETLRILERAAAEPSAADRPFIVPAYTDDSGPRNPVLVRRHAWQLITRLRGDRGLGPFIVQHPELCLIVPVGGTMPDIDSPHDLEKLRELGWPRS